MSTDSIPTLDGYVSPDGVHVRVWCQHCTRWHYHGHGPGEPLGAGDGHRASHCGDGKTRHEDGYYIREVGYFADGDDAAPRDGGGAH